MEYLFAVILGLVLTFLLADSLGFPVSILLDKLSEKFGLRQEETTFEGNYKNKIAIVTEKISGFDKGRVTLEGVTWNAKAEDEASEFIEGERVMVLGVDGNQLLVSRKKN